MVINNILTMNENSDIRYKILEYLNQNGNSTEEVRCSIFLAHLHNDLGTIKRTLIELINKGYINESNVDWVNEKETKSEIFKINTRGNIERKDSKRLLDSKDIKEIRLYLTLDGKRFLIESENLKHTTWMIRNEKWFRILLIFIGALLSLIIQWLSKVVFNENRKPQIIIEREDTIKTNFHSDSLKTLNLNDTIKEN